MKFITSFASIMTLLATFVASEIVTDAAGTIRGLKATKAPKAPKTTKAPKQPKAAKKSKGAQGFARCLEKGGPGGEFRGALRCDYRPYGRCGDYGNCSQGPGQGLAGFHLRSGK